MLAPINHPAEVIDISPEALEVANCYLISQDAAKVSEELNISMALVVQTLNRREVKAYIDHVFMDLGFNNRIKMRQALDAIMAKKFQELDESEAGSNKDILEIMALSHKFTMEHMDRQIELEKLKSSNLRSQVNVQINEPGSNYSSLLEKLINNNL